MGRPLQVTATEFSRSFGKFRDEAFASGVVEITSHGRVIGGFLSAKELDRYNRLKTKEREVLRIEDIDDSLLAEIEAAEYGVIGK